MEWLVWTGTGITLLGCAGLILSVILIARIRAENLEDQAMRERLNKVIPVNLGALLCAAFGLMVVIIGLVLS